MSNHEPYTAAAAQLPSVPVFTGSSGAACEEFIQALRARALAADKEDDGKWMLNYMVTRLSGQALRWHAKLPSTVKQDWDEMVNALLEEYPSDDPEGTPASDAKKIGGSAPLDSGEREGRFKMEVEGAPSRQLWLSYNSSTRNMELTSVAASAVKVRFEDSGSGAAFKIYMPETNETQLIVWKPSMDGFLRLSGRGESNSTYIANQIAAGPVWTLDRRGQLQVRYKINAGDSAIRLAEQVFVHVRTLEVEMTTPEEYEALFSHWLHRMWWARREDYFTGVSPLFGGKNT